jgi:hypothetical protein
MGEISCGKQRDPFNFCPVRKSVEGSVSRGSSGKFGVNVEICHILHFRLLQVYKNNLRLFKKILQKNENKLPEGG